MLLLRKIGRQRGSAFVTKTCVLNKFKDEDTQRESQQISINVPPKLKHFILNIFLGLRSQQQKPLLLYM